MNIQQKLFKSGYVIEVKHFRRMDAEFGDELRVYNRRVREKEPDACELIHATGGLTKVFVTTPARIQFVGLAHCSIKDNYNKKKGFLLALSRAFGEIEKGLLRKLLVEQ